MKCGQNVDKQDKEAKRENTTRPQLLDFKENKWCPEAESNHRHGDFQSPALPTELSGQIVYANLPTQEGAY